MKIHFAENLKNLRKEHSLTQSELANKVFVHKAIISNYENGVRNPSLDVLIQLSTVFNVTIDNLLGIEKEDANDNPRMLDASGLNQKQIAIVSEIIEAFREQN